MKNLALILAAVLAASSANAASIEEEAKIMGRVLLPPSEFDHPFQGEVLITRPHNQQAMQVHCKLRYPAAFIFACAKVDHGICWIVIASDDVIAKTGWSMADIFAHERAHCNGWRHPDPGER